MGSIKQYTFARGVHFNDRKSLSANEAITTMPLLEQYSVSLSQHIGKSAIAVVNIGDSVIEGQMIAKADGNFSANIYSPVCGEVVAITKKKNVEGSAIDCIVIKSNQNTEKLAMPVLKSDDSATIKERVALAGIVGLGGAGFPTSIKLNPPKAVDTLVINAAECEPYLTCDYRVMLERSDEFVSGVKLIAKALGVTNIIIGIEANKMDVYSKLVNYSDIKVVLLKTKYPQGAEKQLIYSCTKRKVPTKGLPHDVGVCVNNVQTAYAVYEAVVLNKPLYERVVTVSGKGIKTPKNIVVKVGTPFSALIDFCGGMSEDTVALIAGGPMTGKACVSGDCSTVKMDGGLLALVEGEAYHGMPTPCIGCGKCAYACPMNLMPMYIDFYTLVGDIDNAVKYGATDCFECGSCAYVCPAKRNIVQSVKLTKLKLKERK